MTVEPKFRISIQLTIRPSSPVLFLESPRATLISVPKFLLKIYENPTIIRSKIIKIGRVRVDLDAAPTEPSHPDRFL